MADNPRDWSGAQQSEFVPEDVKAHPAIRAVWESVGPDHPESNVKTGWNGTQETNDGRNVNRQ